MRRSRAAGSSSVGSSLSVDEDPEEGLRRVDAMLVTQSALLDANHISILVVHYREWTNLL